MKKQKNNKSLTLAVAFVLGCCVFGAPSETFAEEAKAQLAFDLEGITVEAARPDWETKLSPGSVTVIRPDDYKGEQKTLPDLMRKVPGVHVREVNGKGQYTTVTVRGSTAAQVGVFIDGVLSNLGGDSAVDLSTIPVANVERIEVYRGYIPARFPGTYIGGVINIVTKRPDKADVSVELGTSSYGGQKGAVEVTAPLGSGSLMFGTNYESSDGDFKYENYAAGIEAVKTQQLVDSLQNELKGITNVNSTEYKGLLQELDKAKKKLVQEKNPTRYRKYNDYENTNSILKWQNDEWMVKAAWNKVDRHLPDSLWAEGPVVAPNYNGVDLFDNYKYDSRRQKIDTKELMLQNRNNVGKLEWGWMVDYSKTDKEYRAEHLNDISESGEGTPLREWSRYESDKYNAQIDGTYKLADNNMLDFQVNYSHEQMDINGSVLDDENVKIKNENWYTVYGQLRNRYEQEMLNVQIQDTITLDKDSSWFLTPSIKYNRSTITGYSDSDRFEDGQSTWISPKDEQTNSKTTWQVGLKKEFNDNFTMRMTGGTYYRLLNMYEIAGDGAGILPAPNDSGRESTFPLPEEGKQFDISALWHGKTLGAEASTTLTYFWRDSDNMLQLQRYGKDYWCYRNDSKGTARGIELQSSFNWNKLDLDLQATYTKTDAQLRKSTLDGSGYDYLDVYQTFQPEWEGNARLTYNAQSDIAMFVEAHYTDSYYTNSIDIANFACPVDDLLTFNTGVKVKTRSNWEVTVGCNDLFNKGPKLKVRSLDGESYINTEYPVQGRTFYVTAKYDF